MPRVTTAEQYIRYQQLRVVYDKYRSTFGCLTLADQQAILDYYKPYDELTLEELKGNCTDKTKRDPSLPNRAGKAHRRLLTPPKPSSLQSLIKREVTIAPILRPEVDAEKLVSVVPGTRRSLVGPQHADLTQTLTRLDLMS